MNFISRRTNGQGYYINDNRVSGGNLTEGDVWTCLHCQATVIKSAWKEQGGFCHRCNGPLCDPCAAKAVQEGCTPFLKLIERQLQDAHRREQNARIFGI